MSDPAPPRLDLPIRYFCLVLPNSGESLGFNYLQALDQALPDQVLACPIGMAYFTRLPWSDIYRLFQGTTAKRFVNVVVSPPNFLMGTRIRSSDIAAPQRLPGPGEKTKPFAMSKRAARAPRDGGDDEGAVYEPSTAISGLYTVGVPNIAITLPRPVPPSDHEIRALAKYDRVICPTEADAAIFQGLGVAATHVPPEPALLKWLVNGLTL